ncbi:YrzE family protein [Arthrobacter sp. zg-Y916]|uniref:YrzE family protein n=1 Tax=Arthrobacter sp. zg-Y916 TaxID=2894190 RepID=UPI001E2D2466|nr:YrzE family protein [Arthrobacter sp. zg-Y916]MCC9192073.1 YrzE family protein [Arthrobacter sp. zg-Y916]
MSTESGSTAAGEPRRRQADETPSREDAGTASPRPSSTDNEPDVTRRLETPSRGEHTGRAETTGNSGSSGTNDTEVLNTGATGTRDPDGTAHRTDGHDGRHQAAEQPVMPNREALLAAERERFGGIKFGAAFFGWLTATGMVVLLSALAAAIGAAVGVSTDSDLGAALDQVTSNQSANLVGAIITLAVLLLAYYAGGYVAGRMARFNGAKQGVAVWLWALVAAAVVIILGLILNDDIRSLTQLNTVASLPQDLGDVSAGTWLALLATVVVSLIGAILGGLAGMRFHRRVDRAKFTPATA